MSLHVIFIDKDGQQLSDVTSNFTSVLIPQNAFIMRIADDSKSYSNSTLTKLFEIDNTFYSKILEYTTKGDYPFIDVSVQDFGGFTAIFNQLSAQFVGNNPPQDIYDFSGYGGSGSGGDIDFSTIVTALNSIATALSALTNLNNLSNLADLANIITAIQNKDNQSNIVEELRYIFTQNMSQNCYRQIDNVYNLSIFKSNYSASELSNLSRLGSVSIYTLFRHFASLFSQVNYSVSNPDSLTQQSNKTLQRILRCFTTALSSDDFSVVSDKSFLSKIETKLEQNLPFKTEVNNVLVIDGQQEFKVRNKNDDEDFD